MGIQAPQHRAVTVDTGLLVLPLLGAWLGLVVGAGLGQTVLGAILGASAGLVAATTLQTLRSLPYAARGTALFAIGVLALSGAATLGLLVLVWR